jgi:hypothetical protein
MHEWTRDTPTPIESAKYRTPKSQRMNGRDGNENDSLELNLQEKMYDPQQQLDAVSESHSHVNMESEDRNDENYYLIV